MRRNSSSMVMFQEHKYGKIHESVVLLTWPRTKYSILGVHSDGTPLQKDYITTRTIEDEAERSIKQIRFNPEQIVDIKIRKDIVSLLGKDKLPQSLVKPGIDFVVSEKYNATILFSPIRL